MHCYSYMRNRAKHLWPCTRCSQASYSNCTVDKMQNRNIACCSSLSCKTSLTTSNVLSLHSKVKLGNFVEWKKKSWVFLKWILSFKMLCVSGELWWNPEKLDMSTCCYLQLLCHLFDVVVSGASQGPLVPSFRALLQPLLQVPQLG